MEEHLSKGTETTAAPDAVDIAATETSAADPRLRADAMHAEAMRARMRRQATAVASPQNTDNEANPPQKKERRRREKPRKERRGEPEPEYDDHPEHRHGRGHDRLTKRLVLIAIILALLVVLTLLILPRIDKAVAAMTPDVQIAVPDSIQGLLPDETMGYTAIDFTDAILGESRERKELVVMEQDVDVTSKISQELLHISLFSKVKIIRSFGTGVYTVALDEVGEDDVSVDEETKIITVAIPHTVLSYVNVDVDRTEFEDTQRSLLAVGEIKLTAEQKHLLDQSINDTLHERLNDKALFAKADEIALNKVREILQPIVSSISDEYIVKIMIQQAL